MKIDFVEISSIDVAVTIKGTMSKAECRTFVGAFSSAADLDFGQAKWFAKDAFTVRATNTRLLDQDQFLAIDDVLQRLVFQILGQDRVKDTSLSVGDMMVQWQSSSAYYTKKPQGKKRAKASRLKSP